MFRHETKDFTSINSESLYLEMLREKADKNQVFKSYQGMGYYPTLTPNVILRNLFENPNWYTPYTPYQAEIAQGRLESLLNFQTMVSELVGLPVANASLLDEATAAAEAMFMAFSVHGGRKNKFFVSENLFPQSIALLKTRAEPLGIELEIGDVNSTVFEGREDLCGAIVQNPDIYGTVQDFSKKAEEIKSTKALFIVGQDLLAATLHKTPGEMGADIAYGSTQRFGVPMGYGGPHAAFFATVEQHRFKMPGRVIGVSKDSYGSLAYRMAMQAREQHIRRARATSNICTAQALLANMAAMYGVWHGPDGLTAIAKRINHLT
jgi:glycine dehydrogenase